MKKSRARVLSSFMYTRAHDIARDQRDARGRGAHAREKSTRVREGMERRKKQHPSIPHFCFSFPSNAGDLDPPRSTHATLRTQLKIQHASTHDHPTRPRIIVIDSSTNIAHHPPKHRTHARTYHSCLQAIRAAVLQPNGLKIKNNHTHAK